MLAELLFANIYVDVIEVENLHLPIIEEIHQGCIVY
jgi:hypothetical protein